MREGDPCVIIKGVIRNDYDKDYYVPPTAWLYNSKGERTGIVVQPEWPKPITVVYVKSGEKANFLYVLCK